MPMYVTSPIISLFIYSKSISINIFVLILPITYVFYQIIFSCLNSYLLDLNIRMYGLYIHDPKFVSVSQGELINLKNFYHISHFEFVLKGFLIIWQVIHDR